MPRRPPLLIGLLIVAIVVAVGNGLHERQSRPSAPPSTGDVIAGRPRVVDGDSLEVAGHRIRLFGIDAPERSQDCRDARGRTYACGREARDALAAAVGGQTVSCTPVGESYNRDVAVCIANGRDLSEEMVRAAHALELKQHSRGRYSASEREAATPGAVCGPGISNGRRNGGRSIRASGDESTPLGCS